MVLVNLFFALTHFIKTKIKNTAKKDIQNPALKVDIGLFINTIINAADKTLKLTTGLFRIIANNPIQTIINARCVGKEKSAK